MTKSADEFFGSSNQPVQWADRSRRTAPASRQSNEPVRLPEGSLLPSDPEVRQVLTETANKYKLNPALLMAMAQQESNYNPTAVGPKTKWGTAKGMFQFLDDTARRNGIDPTDFRQAAEIAARDLASQTATKGMDWAVAHHHAGPDPKQHGPKTSRYTQEVLTKAAAIARELGLEFQLPNSAKPDFSNVTTDHKPSAEEFFGAAPVEDSAKADPSAESLGRTIQRNVLEGALKGPEFTRTDPVLANVAGAITRTVERGWEGIKNFLDRETETVERTDDELRRIWDEDISKRPTTMRFGLSFDQWARENRTVRVSTKPFAEEEAEWAQRLKDSPEDAHLLPKRLNHLRPKADDSRFKPADTFEGFAQRFISNHKNPIDLLLQDSIPANIVTHLFTLPETERKKFDQARRVTNALEATSNPEGKSEEELELAGQVIADWKKKTDSTIVESWQELWQAAKEDPAQVAVGFSEALAADPYLAAAPMGLGIKPIRAVQATQGIRASTLAGRAAKVADRFIDAASLTAAVNVAAGAAENLATEGVVNDSEVKMNAAMGALIGGPIGAVFMRGARARAKGVDKAKLDGTLEETLRDMAKADVETEARVTDIYRRYPEGHGVGAAQTPLQQQLSELLGIKTYKDAEAWKTQRRKEVKEWFKDNPEYADYQRYVAEERLARSAQLADAAEAKRRSAAEAAHGRSIEDAAAQRERWQQEFDAAIEARNAEEASQEIGSALRAAEAEDAARTLAQKLDAEELFYAQLSEDAPTIRQTEAKIKRREASLRIPKWQRGSTDPKMLAALGITGAGAAAGAAMFPQDQQKGMLAGAIISGLSAIGLGKAVGSRAGGIRSAISQQGALKLGGGNWAAGSVDEITPYTNNWEHTQKITQRYLNRYAGTSDDPLKDFVLPDGTRWEDAMDSAIRRKTTPNKYGELEYSLYKSSDSIPLREPSDALEGSRSLAKIRSYMDHVGDYLRTLPESEVAKMDFVRMVKETKRWDEANARKMEKAQVKFFKDAEVLREYDDGFKWIRLNKPGQFANESDLMGHSVRGYEPEGSIPNRTPSGAIDGYQTNPEWIPEAVGGHANYGYGGWDAIKSDKARVYSLRGPNGKPVATVELGRDLPGERGAQASAWELSQVKGPRNEPVKKEYLNKVEDFISTFEETHHLDSSDSYDLAKIRGQVGSADPETLARLGIVAGGATAGYALFPEDEKLAGGLLGGLAGLVVPAGGSVLSRMRQAGAISSDGQIISALVKAGKMANKLEEPEIRARDQAWIAAARAGDQQAFKDLYETYVGKVTRFANKFVRGRESAIGATGEDIAQDAFLQVFRKLTDDPDFEIDNFPAYMMLAAEGRAINALSAAKTLKRGVDTVNESQYFKEDMYEGDRGSARSILDETTGEIEGNVILDNLKDTPELIAIRDEAMDIIRQAVDELPEQPRQLFTLVNLDHFTPEEAAKQLGMNRDAAYKALQRAETVVRRSVEENRRKLGEPADPSQYRGLRGQRGSVSPDDLRNLAAIAATATAAGTAGYFMTDGNLWKTALLTGLVTPVGAALVKGKLRGSGNVIKGELGGANPVAVAIRSIDWRLKEMGEAIYGLAKKHGKQELEHIKAYNDATAPFIRMFSELPKDVKPIIVKALSTRDKVIIDKMLRQVGGEEFVKAFDQVRKKLDEVEDQLVGYGLIKKSEKDYFPFRVKDLDGLKTHLGKEAASEIDSALAKAEAKMQKLQQRPLTEIEKSVVINKVLEPYLGKPISAHTPGFAKARTIQVIDEKLQPFYHDPIATLNSYGVQAIKYIERAKFFGRHLKKTKNAEGNYAVNIGDSIGEMVADLKNKGQLTDEQGVQLAGMLQDRFNGGEMASSHLVQGTKNLTNAALLGHIASAIVQLGDIAIQASRQGLVPSVRALRRQLTRDKLLDLKNFGLTEHVAHEFLSDGWTRKVADWSFKWGGFRAIDHIGKNFGLNAAVEKMFREAQTPEGILRLSDRFQRVFPDDFDKALGALKKGQVNEAVELMAFAELTRTQPITSWELPQFYHRMPNGRMIYHLQTFSLRVLNMVHEDALKDIASMKPARMAKGTKALLGIGAILGVQGVASDKMKDFVAGKPIELSWEEVPLNALEALGMNMYDYNRIADKGPVAGIVEGKLPPILRMSQQVWEDPERSVRFIPVAGRAVYDRGKDYFEARRRERRKKEGYKVEIRVPPKEESGDRNRNRSRDRNRRRDR